MAEIQTPLSLAPEEMKASTENTDGSDGKGQNKQKSTKNDAAKPALHGQSSSSNDIFDPNFTANVISAMGPKTSPRTRQIMTSLIQHLHDFARDVELTVPEWSAGVDFVPTPLFSLERLMSTFAARGSFS